jgi:hypothetical protein
MSWLSPSPRQKSQNTWGLFELLQRSADEPWIADHLTPEQAAEPVLNCIKHGVQQETELIVTRMQ